MKKRTTVIQLDDSEDNFIRMGMCFSVAILFSHTSLHLLLLTAPIILLFSERNLEFRCRQIRKIYLLI